MGVRLGIWEHRNTRTSTRLKCGDNGEGWLEYLGRRKQKINYFWYNWTPGHRWSTRWNTKVWHIWDTSWQVKSKIDQWWMEWVWKSHQRKAKIAWIDGMLTITEPCRDDAGVVNCRDLKPVSLSIDGKRCGYGSTSNHKRNVTRWFDGYNHNHYNQQVPLSFYV